MAFFIDSIKQSIRLAGIDRAIFFNLLVRGWGVSAGLLTIFFVTRFLSAELQGYYYTFYSLIALQIFVELGLTFAIIQFASHEMAKLSWTPEGVLSGSPESKRRLQSLMRFAVTWFGVAGLLMTLLLLPVGVHFFEAAAPGGASDQDVRGPWILLVIFTAAGLIVIAATAVLEGCGKVAEMAVLRLWQSVFSVAAAWIVLSLDGGLYALAASSFMIVLVGITRLWVKHGIFFRDIFRYSTQLPGMNWRREIWPFQWRIAISCCSGFFISQLFSPLLFATHGPVVAGQMGMSLQIINAINGAALVWITTKAPTYGKLIASKQTGALDAMFFRGLAQSFFFLLIAVISFFLIFIYLVFAESPYVNRILSPYPLAILCIVCLANHLVCSEAAYLRAHKQEPFMVLSIINGLVTAILALLLIPPLGVIGAVYSYAATALLIGLGGGTFVFIQKRKIWVRR